MNQNRLTNTVRRTLCAGLLAGIPALHAQTATPPPVDSESIMLEEFTVSSSATAGYRATNSITSTGLGTRISDTPVPITVVTGELIRDVNATSLAEALTFVPGVGTSPRNESTFIVRGFTGLISYRNGQYRRQLFTSNNVERVEVAKGAAGIFFGSVRPGGVINYITGKAKIGATSTDLSASIGQDAYYKFEAIHNQSLGKNLAGRVFLSVVDAGGDQQFEFLRDRFADISFAWQPSSKQSLTFNVEAMDRSRFYQSAHGSRAVANSKVLFNPLAIAAQANVNQLTTAAATTNRAFLTSQGFSATPGAVNFQPNFDIFAPIYGPNDPLGRTVSIATDARLTQKSRSIDLNYLFKVTDSIVWQTDLNYAYDNTTGIQPAAQDDINPYADGSIRIRTEYFINIRDSFNVDNKINWRFQALGGKHTWQLGQEFEAVVFLRPGYFNATNNANTYNNSPMGAYFTNQKPGVTAPVSTVASLNASGQDFNIRRWQHEDRSAVFVAGQSNFFKERLFFVYGARYNRFSQRNEYNVPVLNAANAAGVLTTKSYGKSDSGVTPQIAALFKIIPEVSAFVNHSTSLEPNYNTDADGNASEAVESSTTDFGIKTELFAGRLVSTITYFDLERGNIAYIDTARQTLTGRAPYYIFGNTEASKGLEAEINWSPVDNYQLIFAYNHFTKAEVTKTNDLTRLGAPLTYNPPTSYTLWNRYEFKTGGVKGLVLGAGLRHADSARLSGDPQNQVIMPEFTTFDVMASYRFKAFNRNFRAQVNVKNVGDKLYRDGNDGYFADRRNISLTLSTRF